MIVLFQYVYLCIQRNLPPHFKLVAQKTIMPLGKYE